MSTLRWSEEGHTGLGESLLVHPSRSVSSEGPPPSQTHPRTSHSLSTCLSSPNPLSVSTVSVPTNPTTPQSYRSRFPGVFPFPSHGTCGPTYTQTGRSSPLGVFQDLLLFIIVRHTGTLPSFGGVRSRRTPTTLSGLPPSPLMNPRP